MSFLEGAMQDFGLAHLGVLTGIHPNPGVDAGRLGWWSISMHWKPQESPTRADGPA